VIGNIRQVFTSLRRPELTIRAAFVRLSVFLPLLGYAILRKDLNWVAVALSADAVVGYGALLYYARRINLKIRSSLIFAVPTVVACVVSGGYLLGRNLSYWPRPTHVWELGVQGIAISLSAGLLMALLEYRKLFAGFREIKLTRKSPA